MSRACEEKRSERPALQMALAETVPFAAEQMLAGPPESKAAKRGYGEAFMRELDIELNEKVKQMLLLYDHVSMRLEASLKAEILRLPPAIKAMSMREFCIEYGGDIDQALIQQAKRSRGPEMMPPPAVSARAEAQQAASAKPRPARGQTGGSVAAGGNAAPARTAGATRPTRGRATKAVETPQGGAAAGRTTRSRIQHAAPTAATPGICTPGAAVTASCITPKIHETPRQVRLGEVALSANGSPINLVNTVKATQKADRQSGVALSLSLVDGTELDLSDEIARSKLEMDPEKRAQAVRELLKMQAEISAHLQALQSGCDVEEDE